MTIHWLCSCGKKFENGFEAFLHRDGTSTHHVTPRIEFGEERVLDYVFIPESEHLSRGARV